MKKSKSLSYFKEYGVLYAIAYLMLKRLPKFIKYFLWNFGVKFNCYDKFIIAAHGSGNNAISYFLKNSNALILAGYTGDGKKRYCEAISKMYNKDTKIVYLNCFYDDFSKYIDLISGKKPSILMLVRDPISNLVTNCNVKHLHKDSFRLGDDLESFFDNLFVYHGYSIVRNEYITNHHPTLEAVLLLVKSEINYKNNDIRNIFERPPRFQYFENTLLNLFKDKNISIIDMKDLANDKITDTLRFISELFGIEFRDNIYTKRLVNFLGSMNIDCSMYRAGGGVIITTILGGNKKGYVDISDDILGSKDSQDMSYLKIYCNDLELLKCDSFKHDINNFCYRLHIKIQDENNKRLTEKQVLQYLKESELYAEFKELLAYETTIVRLCAPHIYESWKYYKEFLE